MWISASHSAEKFGVCLFRKCCLLMLQGQETNPIECWVTELAGTTKLWLCRKFLNVIALRHKAIPWSREHAQSNENNYRLFHVYRRMLYLNILFYSGHSTYKWTVCAKHNARSNKRIFITHSCSFVHLLVVEIAKLSGARNVHAQRWIVGWYGIRNCSR
jgi:hypothetical protein